MRDKLNTLIVERGDIKQQLINECLIIKEKAEETGFLSSDESQALSGKTMADMGGLGMMSAIPQILGKLTPLKECVPHISKAILLLGQYTELLEQQTDINTMLIIKGL